MLQSAIDGRDQLAGSIPVHQSKFPLPSTNPQIAVRPQAIHHNNKRPRHSKTPSKPDSDSSQPSSLSHQLHIYDPRVLIECHICHRRPLIRSQVPLFGNCEACGRRACDVCLRECEGLCMYDNPAESRKVCSTCCVERGVDGTVWCLLCAELFERPEWRR